MEEEYKELELLKKTLKDCLASDEMEQTFFYLDEFIKYQKGFNILIEYFDNISDEEKPKVSKQLEELQL